MYRLVKLEWLDIIRPEETWLFPEDAKALEPAKITTIGWVVYSTNDHIVIASSLGDDKQLGDINCIPRAVIISMEDIS
jgi:hypothetical protein